MIDVIKLPKDLDIDNKIIKKAFETYGICPYCESKGIFPYQEYWCSTPKGEIEYKKIQTSKDKKIGGSGLFANKYNWYKIRFTCYNCGMVWETPEFPELGGDIKANNAIFHAYQNGKNMEVNTLLLECFKE